MAIEYFEGCVVEIVDTYDCGTANRVIEFRASGAASGAMKGFAVFLPEDGDWTEAKISIDPQVQEVSARFAEWALSVAKARVM